MIPFAILQLTIGRIPMRLSAKISHEVRCPIHGFIRFNNLERSLIDSRPLQRLKHIHQLAMTYQVYPGATHRRFEHSLGVMDLAGRAFDSLMRREKLPYGAALMAEAADDDARGYWRQVLRIAALLHDTGHLPFSHAAESELLLMTGGQLAVWSTPMSSVTSRRPGSDTSLPHARFRSR
jgi:HD superfamily phosphohydrolase